MIWTSQFLTPECIYKSENLKKRTISSHEIPKNDINNKYIGIIGGGPKGFYAFERLIANLRKKNLSQKIVIHWFNSNDSFAAGQNYLINQPDYLLVNYCIGNINCWEEDDCIDFIDECLNLTEWINKNTKVNQQAINEHFATRELVGHYLMNSLYDVLHYTIPNVEIHLISANIQDLDNSNHTFRLTTEADQKLPFEYSSVILTTGHCYHNEPEKILTDTPIKDFVYIQHAYPIANLDQIRPKTNVAIKGIGLTFLDVCLHLTEGRGGKFSMNGTDMQYIPSGQECTIYAYSRNNIPMLPKTAVMPYSKYKLRYMTDEWLETLKSQNRQIDFEQDILSIYDKEVKWAIASTFYKDENLNEEELFERIINDGVQDLASIHNVLYPNKIFSQLENESYNDFIKDLSQFVLSEIGDGEFLSKIAAGGAACREGLLQIGKLYDFDGFSPSSQKEFDSKWYSALSRVSYGPPLVNGQKIYALVKANIIRFEFFETPHVESLTEGITLTNGHISIPINALIDARIPRGSIKKGNNILYKNLHEKGIIEERLNGDYQTDAIAIERNGKLKNKQDWMLTLYGTPTEGNVLDNDSLSRKNHNYGNLWAEETATLMNHYEE